MSDSPRPWTRLASRRLIERWWMTLRQDRVRLPSGHVLDEYHVLEYPDWSCVLALTNHGEAVIIQQYRYAIERVCTELPAGALDAGESPLEAAQRELLEETGYVAERWTALGRCAVEPSRHTNFGYLFVAEDARRVAEPTPDASEDLVVACIPAGDLMGLVETGEIVHGVHVAAVLWAAQRGFLPQVSGDAVNR